MHCDLPADRLVCSWMCAAFQDETWLGRSRHARSARPALPVDLLVNIILCQQAAVLRLYSHPGAHPLALHGHVRRAERRLVWNHRSSLHEVIDGRRPFLIYAVSSTPGFTDDGSRSILLTSEDCDASAADYADRARVHRRGIGAAYKLGPSTRHNFTEAEVVATTCRAGVQQIQRLYCARQLGCETTCE